MVCEQRSSVEDQKNYDTKKFSHSASSRNPAN
jgi:hypothetical protein